MADDMNKNQVYEKQNKIYYVEVQKKGKKGHNPGFQRGPPP